MKINIKALELIELGFTSKTVSKLTESQINVLHSKLINEQAGVTQKNVNQKVTQISQQALKTPQGVAVDGSQLSMDAAGNVVMKKTSATEEVKEDDEVSLDPNKDTETQDPHQVGPSTNDGFNDDDDGMYNFESIEEEKKYGEKNPWAICHAQLGPRKNAKFESCVKQVKKSLKEGKNPLTLFVENKIMEIVETHLPPKLTKKDLMKYLSEAEPATAPVKEPKTKPGTKTPPIRKPSHPGKNPNPNVNPAPKAKKIDPEQAKEKIIDTIIKMLEK